ncbi:response regulator [Parachryseolinea silvisoli]|uniref:response regulator n=1 Tax=Parachryseolinea silvisoli TaxID=2873601 RepID=UPI002265EFD6|nr:response regulator [Parachryseolinea silvisoli]MCD9018233.1 response regulator [Parachryseolinea silvisoli]
MKSFYSIRHVYYADDDPDDRFLFQEVVSEIDVSLQLTLADSGHALLDTLRTTPTLPDVIFLDWNMPVKNGFQCLKEIKQHPRLKDIPVVMISTSSENSVSRATLEGGAFQYIQKPVYFAQLKTLIYECLQNIVALRHETQ